MTLERRLTQIKKGSKAKLTGFEDEVLGNRLLEMGWIPGEIIAVDNISPFGGPLIISMANNRYTIRKEEAASVKCEPYE